jgi:hypothetical protein
MRPKKAEGVTHCLPARGMAFSGFLLRRAGVAADGNPPPTFYAAGA